MARKKQKNSKSQEAAKAAPTKGKASAKAVKSGPAAEAKTKAKAKAKSKPKAAGPKLVEAVEPDPSDASASEPAGLESELSDEALSPEEGASPPVSEGGGPEDPAEAETHLKSLIEAVLFVADRPIELKELARLVKLDRKRLTELLALLTEDYKDRGIYLQEVGGGYAFRTNPVHSVTVKKFLAQRPVRLSRAQLETLAIIAYRQPITRPEVDDIRGVDSGPVLKGLLDRELIRILGKKDEPGRPMLYGTSPQFLELFNLGSLQDLPTLKEFTELSDDSRLTYENETGEDVPEGSLIPDVAVEESAEEQEPSDSPPQQDADADDDDADDATDDADADDDDADDADADADDADADDDDADDDDADDDDD